MHRPCLGQTAKVPCRGETHAHDSPPVRTGRVGSQLVTTRQVHSIQSAYRGADSHDHGQMLGRAILNATIAGSRDREVVSRYLFPHGELKDGLCETFDVKSH